MDNVKLIIGVFTAIIGVAIVSALMSKGANTAGVISAATTGFGQDLGIALSPITGQGFSTNTLSNAINPLGSIIGG